MTLDLFAQWWDENSDNLRRFVVGLLMRHHRPSHHTDDILQQAFVDALVRVRFDEIDPHRIDQFVFWWLRNRFMDWLRKDIRRENHEFARGLEQAQSFAKQQGGEAQLEDEQHEEIRQAIFDAKLSVLEYLAFIGWFESLGDREEGAERMRRAAKSKGLSVSSTTYDQAKCRALNKLRPALERFTDLITQISYDWFVSLLVELVNDDSTRTG